MRPRFVWGTFAACVAVLSAAMAWSTAIGLRLERVNAAVRVMTLVEENTRLALWRLDTAAMPLIGQESRRPYFQYDAYYDAATAYPMRVRPAGSTELVPSPLLRQTPAGVLLHFQVAPGGGLTSPEVPTGRLRARALEERLTTPARLTEGEERLATLKPVVARASIWRAFAEQRKPAPMVQTDANAAPLDPLLAQKMKSAKEYEQRALNNSNQAVALNNPPSLLDQEDPFALFRQPLRTSGNVWSVYGVVAPLWVDGQLFLAREVRVDGVTYGQAVLVDWPRLRRELLASVADLLPHAQLLPAPDPTRHDERGMTTLPLRLVPGPVESLPAGRSVVRLSLAGAWLGLVVAAAAVALLLRAVMALSERRRVFVSAVTHELRTPLTTFRLYTDMMAEGMVPTEERRKEYLERLRVEADRLGHLVENVLAYARLENRRAAAVRELVDLRALAGDVVARLADRVREAGLTVAVDPGDGEPVRVRADASIVEQILVNLVDNACKYAHASQPPTIEVSVERAGDAARVRVRDHGPGLSSAARRRLFEPFSKSDHEAAASAPGLGLGLALCRSLARDQGGDLEIDDTVTDGAAFVLTLRV